MLNESEYYFAIVNICSITDSKFAINTFFSVVTI